MKQNMARNSIARRIEYSPYVAFACFEGEIIASIHGCLNDRFGLYQPLSVSPGERLLSAEAASKRM